MDITRIAIRNDRVTLTILAVVLIAGVISYLSLPRNEDPGFIIRTAQIVTMFPGASPERMEQLVTDKLEEVVKEIPELDYVTSESRTGVSVVLVEIQERFTQMRPIWDSLRRKINDVTGELPEGVIGPEVNDEFGDVFGIVVSLIGDGFTYAELKDVADQVRDELLRLSDAAKVEIYGAQEEQVFVEYNNARLTELGISPVQLSQILESRNIIVPGGYVDLGSERIALEPSGNFESVQDLERTIIQIPGQAELLYLQDIAKVRRSYIDPPSNTMRSSGTPALGLGIAMRVGGNIIDLGADVRTTIDQLKSQYPIGIEFDIVSFQPDVVDKKVKDFAGNLYQAVFIVAMVMLVFLGLRTGLIVASLIPIAMITSFLLMSFFNIGLDQMSLAALIIALGMLVDNGIVMAENIMVQRQQGKEAISAAIDSANELKVPLLTSSITTAAAFLPIYLAESSTGEYTAPLFEVVSITLLSSWLIALTVIPLLTVRFMKPKKVSAESFDTSFYRNYRATLLFALKNKIISIGAVILMFAMAIYGLGYVPNIFFPPSDRPFFKAELELPFGTSIETTEKMVTQVDQFIRSDLLLNEDRENGVTNWATYIGGGGPRFVLQHGPKPSTPGHALFVVNVNDYLVIDEVVKKLDRYVHENFPDVLATIKKFENGPPVTKPVQVRVSGKDRETLFDLVDQVKSYLVTIPGTKNIDDDWGAWSKKLIVRIDQARARRAGVTSQDIAVSLQSGLTGLTLTEYREGEDIIPVTLRTEQQRQSDINKLETLTVYAQATGDTVPLKQVAEVEVIWEPALIKRRDGLKTVTVNAEVQSGVTAAEVFAPLESWLKETAQSWPVGYRWEFGGEAESSQKANQSIAEKLPIAILIILVLLVGQFNSIRKPIIILVTIPLGLIGITVGLLVLRSYFGFMTLLGVISLAGIVINNAIVLLERINLEMNENKLPPNQAIIEAAQRRLRPILLTTATTVLGLIPLYLGGGPMWEPMAISIIFGLLFATILTLGLVPVLYSILFRVSFKDFQYISK